MTSAPILQQLGHLLPAIALAACVTAGASSTFATAPAEVQGVHVEKQGAGEVLGFDYLPRDSVNPVKQYTVYRGRLGSSFNWALSDFGRLRTSLERFGPTNYSSRATVAINDTDDRGMPSSYFFLVTATNADGEGSLGSGTSTPRGGVYGDPPTAAPELYPMTWSCVPYTGAPPPPFPPPVPPGFVPPHYEFPDLCPPGLVPVPKQYESPKGTPDGMALAGGLTPSTGAYYYAWVQSSPTAYDDGAFGRMTVESPVIDNNALTHSLAEIAVRGGPGFSNYVEVGWTVDRLVNSGDVAPHLFVFRWVNGVPGVYNGSGWVQFAPQIVPGMKLATQSLLPAGYVYWAGNWWCFVLTQSGGGWIGYFPGSLWGGGFTNVTLNQWFGEVYAAPTPPGNQMGNGGRGSSFPGLPIPAYIDVMSEVDLTTWSAYFPPITLGFMTNSAWYDLLVLQTPNGFFFYGGPGQ